MFYSRREIPSLVGDNPPGHQAGQSTGELELPAQDLRLRFGTCRRGEQEPRNDPGGRHAVLPCARATSRRTPLRFLRRHVVCRMHLWRAPSSKDSLLGPESSQTGSLFSQIGY